MMQLETTKERHTITPFVSDGCSGNLSKNWHRDIQNLSGLSSEFAERYQDEQQIPFESACVSHDESYHKGTGGYSARLQADNTLRADIIAYGITNADDIQQRTMLGSPEEVMFVYEKIAEVIYQGVRLGGAPCTGEPYAWGYGYKQGACVD
jgi:hypothetical protein